MMSLIMREDEIDDDGRQVGVGDKRSGWPVQLYV